MSLTRSPTRANHSLMEQRHVDFSYPPDRSDICRLPSSSKRPYALSSQTLSAAALPCGHSALFPLMRIPRTIRPSSTLSQSLPWWTSWGPFGRPF